MWIARTQARAAAVRGGVATLRGVVLAAALGVAGLAVASGPAGATYPGANGRIVWSQGNQIRSVLPDGTGPALLATVTSPSGLRSAAFSPSFSADGSKIAVMLREFDRPTPCDPRAVNADSGVCQSIVVMNSDGSGQRVIYASEDISGGLALSPDGSQVAFTKLRVTGTSAAREQLYLIGVSSRHRRLLTRQTGTVRATDAGPSWSPDGTEVAFFSSRDDPVTGRWSLSTVDVQTGAISRIIPGSANNDLEPNWAPSGERFAFLRTFAYPDYRIVTVNRDGTDEQEIVRDQGPVELPVWSPDGTQLVYKSGGDLWLVGSDGANPHALATVGAVSGLDWEPVPGS